MEIRIEKEYNYLGEVPYFKENGLPTGYLIDKGKTGCGGTSIALENEIDTIICVPYIELIINKLNKYKDSDINILGVYGDVKDNDIKHYLKYNIGVKKIICTYDSLKRITDIVGYDYFLLVDELHKLFKDYSFRYRAVRNVLDEYTKFKSWAFMTATPIEKDLMLEELKDIPICEIIWEDVTETKVNLLQCKQVLATTKSIVSDFLNGKIFGNAHFFINSVQFISNIIKDLELDNNNTRIIFSRNNTKYKSKCQGIINGSTTDEVKKINFYTSTCFEGCDLYDRDGKIYIVSDSKEAQTLYDISTDIQQIAGRIRDTLYYNNITHVFKQTRYNNNLTLNEYKDVVLKEEKVTKSIMNKLNSDDELKTLSIDNYNYLYKEEGEFRFDPNRMKLDIHNFKLINHLYSLRINIDREYKNNNCVTTFKSDNTTSDKLLKSETSRTSFKDAIEEYNSILERQRKALINFSDNDRISLLVKKYPNIKEAYEKLGLERIEELRYRYSLITRELLILTSNTSVNEKIIGILKTIYKIRVGAVIEKTKLRDCFQKIYDKLGINKKPTKKKFEDFMVLKDTTKKVNKEPVNCYVIQHLKYR